MAVIVDPAVPPLADGVNLCAVWLNNAANPADLVALSYAGDALNLTASGRAEVRQLAGRRRVVRRGWKVYLSGSLQFQEVTGEQSRWLQDHVGIVLCFRDHVGTKFFGMYAESPRQVATWTVTGEYLSGVSITVDEVDFSEAVD